MEDASISTGFKMDLGSVPRLLFFFSYVATSSLESPLNKAICDEEVYILHYGKLRSSYVINCVITMKRKIRSNIKVILFEYLAQLFLV